MLPPFRDCLREYDELRDEILAAVDREFKSGRLTLGPEGVAFEREMAPYIGATGGVGVISGTDAMILLDSVVRPHVRTVVAPL
jgi:aminotransferase EvaB